MKKKTQATEIDLSLIIPGINGRPNVAIEEVVIENMRQAVTRLERNNPLPGRIALVSALREEGVTATSLALAATIAHDLMARVCVVDLNWWFPSTSPLIDPANRGLSALLLGEASLDDVISPTGWPNLSILPAGLLPRESRPVVARSSHLRQVIEVELTQRFDHLILDIPAIRSTSDAVSLAGYAEAAIVVLRQGATSVEEVRLALDEITHLKILGVVMNQVRLTTPRFITRAINAW